MCIHAKAFELRAAQVSLIRELYFSKADVPPLTIAANRPTLNKQREHFTAFYTLLPFSIPPFQICTKLYYLNMKEAEIYHFLIIFDWVWYFRIFPSFQNLCPLSW